MPDFGCSLVLIRTNVVLVWHVIVLVLLAIASLDLLLSRLKNASTRLLGFLVLVRPDARQGNVLLVIELLVKLEIVVVEDDLDDALECVLASVQELLERVADLFKHESRWIE